MAVTIKYLFLDGTNYKTISGTTLSTVCTTADSDTIIENAFLNSGLNDLSSFNNSITTQFTSNTFQIVMYKK